MSTRHSGGTPAGTTHLRVRAALNEVADDIFRSLDAHDEERRRSSRASMPEQAVHLRAALAAADQRADASDDDGTVDAAFDQGSEARVDLQHAQHARSDDHADAASIRRDDHADLLTRVLRQVTERCESSELEVQHLRAALRHAEARHAADAARIEQLTAERAAISANFEWTRTRLDEIETAASENAAIQVRALEAAQASEHSLTRALEQETRRSCALESRLAATTAHMARQADQLASVSAAYDGLQQLVTRIISGVGEAGERMQHLIEHQKSRLESLDQISPAPAQPDTRTTR
ncbi:MAG: hypothetical protein U0Q11_19785 [Vicinamibacterales bacterium]